MSRAGRSAAAGTGAAARPGPARARGAAHALRPQAQRAEQQAAQRGAAFARGRHGLGQGLLAMPPAALQVGASVGHPLPVLLRAELETAFDACLDAVRVHRDTAAAAAAAAHGSQAFASGADLYFAGGAYAPQWASGRELIAHEVAHVLQQTAQLGADGKLHARPVHGLGDPQFRLDFEGLRALHGGTAPAAEFTSRAEEIKVASVDQATLQAYFERVFPAVASWPIEALGLLYDMCKRRDLFEQACKLIERDNYKGGINLLTGFHSEELLETLEKRSTGVWVFQRAIENIPDLKLYRSEWLRLIEAYLFQSALTKPTPLVRNLDPASGAKSKKWQSIGDHVAQLLAAYRGATEPLPNEWYFRGLRHLNAIDEWRVSYAETERSEGAKRSRREIDRRRYRIGRMRRLADAVRTMQFVDGQGQVNTARTAAWLPFNEKLADAVITVVEKVEARWAALDRLHEQMADPATHGAPSTAQLEAIAQLATSSGLSTRLVEAVVGINKTPKDGNRLPGNYPDIAIKHGSAVHKVLTQQIDAKLPAWHRGGRSDQVVAGLWLIEHVWPVRDLLNFETAPFGTEAMPHTVVAAVEAGADVIVAHRIAVARWLADLAPTLRSAELTRRAQQVLTAELEKESQLALLPGEDGRLWTQSAVSKEKVLEDFANVPLRGAEAVTPYAWLLLYEAEYLTRLKAALDRALPADEAGEKLAAMRSAKPPSLTGEASKTVRAAMEAAGRTPQRWSVPEDGKHVMFAQRAGGLSFSEALFHRLGKESFYADALGKNLVPIVPIEDIGRAFVWFWPRYVDMVRHLRALAVYNELVARERFGAADAAALQKVVSLPDTEWSSTLGAVMKVKLDPQGAASTRFSADELARIVKALSEHFGAELKGREAALQGNFQRAARIDRLWLAAWATRGLAMFEADRHRTGLRDDIFDQIKRFYFSLLVVFRSELPGSDDAVNLEVGAGTSPRLHAAALLLTIAPEMSTALKYEDAAPFIAANLGLFEDALASGAVLLQLGEVQRSTFLHADERGQAWLLDRWQLLATLVQALRARRRKAQLHQGFTASKQKQTLDVQMRFSSEMPVGTAIYPRTGYGFLGSELAGKYYRFLGVHRDFIYHPPFGHEQPQTLRSIRSGHAPAMLFELDGSTPLVLAPGEKLLQIEETDAQGNTLRIFGVGGAEADQSLLAQIYSGALYWAFASSMANIQAAIETYVSTLADVAELIPGWGQAITAARIVATIAEFWTDETYKEMLRIIRGDTAEILKGLFDKLGEMADPGVVIELLLFGHPSLNAALSSSTMVAQTKTDKSMQRHAPAQRGKFAALKATFAKLKALGKAFARRMDALHTRVQQPMQDARIYTSTRPALSMALHFGATHIYEIQALMAAGAALLAMADASERAQDASLMDRLREQLGQEQATLGEKIHGLVGKLATIELPARVIDMDGAVQLILAEMMAFVGKRLGLKGKAVVVVLEGSGALNYFAGKVAHEIVAAGFDPNVYWRDEVVPLLADKFHAARDSLVKDLNELLARPAFDQMFTPIAKGAPLDIRPDPAVEYEEPGMQPAAASDRTLEPRPQRLPARGEGRPLAEAERPALERAFGQDLRHVRVHAGGEGEAMTRAFGADALASGSHVFLRQSLDPRQGRGQQVMQHELAHVLQQSGPRPLGRPASERPLPPHPERGLLIDPASEAEAHQLAAAVGARLRGGSAAAPRANARAQGARPYTVEPLDPYLLYRLLRGMNRLDEIKKQEEVLDKHSTSATLARSEDTSAVTQLVDVLTKATHKRQGLHIKAPDVFNAPIDAAQPSNTKALDRMLGELKKALDETTLGVVASHIAKEAQVPLPQHKAAPGLPPPPAKEYVHPSHFARQLEGYILGKTGVALALGLKTHDLVAPDGSKVQALDPTAPLASIAVLHLHLPYVAPNSDLARFAILNTWPEARDDDRHRAKLAAVVQGVLQGMGIRSSVWALFGKQYAFSSLLKNRVGEVMLARLTEGGALDPDKLTPPQVYADADLGNKQTNPIGTRVATYGHANQVAAGRHSHHLTQFLVAEYFANQNDRKPFKPGIELPGVTWDASDRQTVSRISPDPTDADKGIKTKETWGGSSRGGKMPAVSLAAATHMEGDLHITPQPDDLKGSTRKTQAFAVDSTFRSGLPDALKLEKQASALPAYVKSRGAAEVARELHAQVIATFSHWAGHMNRQLLANMPSIELAYYMTLAAGNTTDRAVKAVAQSATEQSALKGLLGKVATTAVAENWRVMGELGWKKA